MYLHANAIALYWLHITAFINSCSLLVARLMCKYDAYVFILFFPFNVWHLSHLMNQGLNQGSSSSSGLENLFLVSMKNVFRVMLLVFPLFVIYDFSSHHCTCHETFFNLSSDTWNFKCFIGTFESNEFSRNR